MTAPLQAVGTQWERGEWASNATGTASQAKLADILLVAMHETGEEEDFQTMAASVALKDSLAEAASDMLASSLLWVPWVQPGSGWYSAYRGAEAAVIIIITIR